MLIIFIYVSTYIIRYTGEALLCTDVFARKNDNVEIKHLFSNSKGDQGVRIRSKMVCVFIQYVYTPEKRHQRVSAGMAREKMTLVGVLPYCGHTSMYIRVV